MHALESAWNLVLFHSVLVMEMFWRKTVFKTPGSLITEVLTLKLVRYSLQKVVFSNSSFVFRVDFAEKEYEATQWTSRKGKELKSCPLVCVLNEAGTYWEGKKQHKYLSQYLHTREKERVTQATLTLSFHSVWLLNLETSMVSECRFKCEQYAWITYTPINDARGTLHTI